MLNSRGRRVAVLGVLWMAVGPASGQPAAGRAAQTADGRPNLNGIWQALNTANWDIEAHEARPGPPQFGALLAAPAGLGVVDGPIPYQPWAAAKKKENFDKRWTDDPEAKCYLPGVPRATYMPFPFQIVQGTDKIMMIYEYAAAARTIHLGKVPEAPIETWMGHSSGDGRAKRSWWTSRALMGRLGSIAPAIFRARALHVVERFTPIDADAINYEVTIEDPKMYTRPWTMRMPLYRRLEKAPSCWNSSVCRFPKSCCTAIFGRSRAADEGIGCTHSNTVFGLHPRHDGPPSGSDLRTSKNQSAHRSSRRARAAPPRASTRWSRRWCWSTGSSSSSARYIRPESDRCARCRLGKPGLFASRAV